MNLRAYLRLTFVPLFVMTTSLVSIIGILWVPQVRPALERQLDILPLYILCVASALSIAFTLWYFLSFAAVRRGTLMVSTLTSRHRVDLRRLVVAEVIPKSGGGSKRGTCRLIMRLEDSHGRQLCLPLNIWRDEDLLMARVLRGIVDSKLRIEGEPAATRSFSGLLDSYKSWDRQQTAA